MPSIPSITLNDGVAIPQIAFGTATAHWQKECSKYILNALNSGFRHFDTAEMYNNEESIRTALSQWGGRREDVFITTKAGNPNPDAKNDIRASLLDSLGKLGTSYVDLYLIHEPKPNFVKGVPLVDMWKTMEQLKREGFCRSIGVGNFEAKHIEEIKDQWTVTPSINQIEYSPYCAHETRTRKTLDVCREHGITVSPYSSLASLDTSKNGPVDPVVNEIAKAKGASLAQVLLAWAAQVTGGPVVTTSDKQAEIDENIEAFDRAAPLSEDEVASISKAGEGRTFRFYTDKHVDEERV